jgi:hypothetical protein
MFHLGGAFGAPSGVSRQVADRVPEIDSVRSIVDFPVTMFDLVVGRGVRVDREGPNLPLSSQVSALGVPG